MKKKICILLFLALIVTSFVACGKESEENEGMTISVDSIQDIVALPIVETEPPAIESTPSLEMDAPEHIVQIVPSDEPAAEGEFGASAAFTGIYKINGYSAMRFGSSRSLSLDLEGVDNNNSGEYEASETTIPNYITDFKDYIYLKLVFDNNGLTSWSFIDKVTMADLGQASESEMNAHLFAETTYEQVLVGALPDEILLSQYAPGKMYVFNLETTEDGSYSLPPITNDTDMDVLAISIRVGEDEEFRREMKVNKVINGNSINLSFGSGDADKVYLAVTESSVDYLVKTADCLLLSKCEVGAKIDFDFEDYVYNDTDKVITLSCRDKQYTLQPREVVECSWMNDIVVESAE